MMEDGMTAAMEPAPIPEVSLPSRDLAADIALLVERFGFRLDTIFPADDPSTATLSGHGARIRLNRLPLPAGDGEKPDPGALIARRVADDDGAWVVGRAGMEYRDLIPGRLGGALIASHIRIREAGPVKDLVHFHDITFQLIFCHRGWVRVVYEDQGGPFVLNAGDCLIQPPRIRHRVLECSANLEVIEVSAPARHLTTMDHEMTLPTAALSPDRDFSGQHFCRSESGSAVWTRSRLPGFESRETGIAEATRDVASVRTLRPANSHADAWTSHTADILFLFIRSGSVALEEAGRSSHSLRAGDACVLPSSTATALRDPSRDLEILEVAFPARFETRMA
jgi:mannose-6-phosphate isomerase-like protein (cupin superfamily)